MCVDTQNPADATQTRVRARTHMYALPLRYEVLELAAILFMSNFAHAAARTSAEEMGLENPLQHSWRMSLQTSECRFGPSAITALFVVGPTSRPPCRPARGMHQRICERRCDVNRGPTTYAFAPASRGRSWPFVKKK